MLTSMSRSRVTYFCPHILLLPPHSLSSSHTGSLLALEHIKDIPTTGPLYWLFPLTEMLGFCFCFCFCFYSTWVFSFSPPGLSSYTAFSRKPVLPSYLKQQAPPPYLTHASLSAYFSKRHLSSTYLCGYCSIYLLFISTSHPP